MQNKTDIGTTEVRGLHKKPRQEHWRTKGGTKIAIDMLADDHLQAILSCLKRNAGKTYRKYKSMNNHWTDLLPAQYDDLQLEAYRRNLITKDDIITNPKFHYNYGSTKST